MARSFSLMGVEKSANQYFTLTDAEISKKFVKVDNYGEGRAGGRGMSPCPIT